MREPSRTFRAIKRTLDVTGALSLLLVAGPVMMAVALLIWAQDPKAPIFFRQRRCGHLGRTFHLYKFRTMVRDADALKEKLRPQSLVPWPDFRLAPDPRVTKVGRILRKTSLDELPQLINVIKGEMSLVGPRPTSFGADTYQLWQTARLEYRPGVTGPWQVWGRNSMDFEERCRLEISFFVRPSLRREIWLLFTTVGTVLRRTGVA